MFAILVRVSLLAALVIAGELKSQTTYWVKPGGNDGANGLSFTNAWEHLDYAVTQVSSGDTILVTPGDYDVDGNNEVFPIAVPGGVTIRGSTTTGTRPDPVDYPHIGGDVNQTDSTVRAVFELIGDGEAIDGATLRWLRFVGEDIEDEDAPHAIYVEVMDDGEAELLVDTCIIERSEMNNMSSTDDRESILALCGDGIVDVRTVGCTVTPNLAGGVRVGVGDDCFDELTSGISHLVVDSCTFELSGAQESAFAINNLLASEGEERTMISSFVIVNNTIDSRGFTGDGGFQYGIVVGVSAEGAGEEDTSSLSITHGGGDTVIEGNDIRGTRSAGMMVLCEVVDHGFSNVQIWNVNRNTIMENAGDGLVFDFGVSASQAAYMRCQTQSNLLVENQNGLLLLNAEDQQGGFHFAYDAYAHNADYGVVIDAPADYVVGWANSLNVSNGDGAYFSSAGWDPGDVTYWSTNDWAGAATYYFVDAANGDYHIHPSAAARNAGTNAPSGMQGTLISRDLFGGNRIAETTTDLGPDEHNP